VADQRVKTPPRSRQEGDTETSKSRRAALECRERIVAKTLETRPMRIALVAAREPPQRVRELDATGHSVQRGQPYREAKSVPATIPSVSPGDPPSAAAGHNPTETTRPHRRD